MAYKQIFEFEGRRAKPISYQLFKVRANRRADGLWCSQVGAELELYVRHWPEYVKKLICEDILFLCRDVLGYAWNPKKREGIMCPPDRVHRHMRKLMERPERYIFGVYPRGTYKSTILGIGRPLQLKCRDFEDTVGIVGETWPLARFRLKAIQAHMEQNKYLVELYGRFMPKIRNKGSVWNRNFIYINQREGLTDLINPCINTGGLDSHVTGMHPRTFVLDDPVSDDNTGTQDQIKKTTDYIDGVVDLVGPGGQLLALGTPRRVDDLFYYCEEKWGDQVDYLTGEKLFYIEKMPIWNHERKSHPIMPSKYPVEAIKTLYETKPLTTFATQYLVNPSAGGNTLVQAENISTYFSFDYTKDNWKALIALDPGRSKQKHKCHTGLVLAIAEKPHDLWIDKAARMRANPTEVINKIKEWVLDPHYFGKLDIILVETNSFQIIYEGSILNMLRELKEEYKNKKRLDIVSHLQRIRTGDEETTANKDDRIMAMEPYFRHDQIHIHEGLTDYIWQAREYPNIADYNRDLLDATTFFFSELGENYLVNPFGIINTKEPPMPRHMDRRRLFPRKAGDEDEIFKEMQLVAAGVRKW